MRALSFITLLLLLPGLAAAQTTDGYIDFDQSVEEQIARLEQMVGGDSAAFKQVVILQWLIQLYKLIERYGDVEQSYNRILVFYPNDIGTLNSYGAFLMYTLEDYERAEKVLRDAHLWGQAMDERSLDRGTTYQLWAQLDLLTGDVEQAVERAERSLEFAGETATSDLLRTLGQAYLANDRFDDAADTYLRLIALDGGSNPDDINDLQLFANRTTKYADGSINELVVRAVKDADAARHAQIVAEGGAVVTVTVDDGVVLEGTLRHAQGKGAVLFVHDVGGHRASFTPYGQILFIDDITTLSVDLRGHGASRADSLSSSQSMPPRHVSRLPDDVLAAYHHLTEEMGFDEKLVVVVAEGRGCALVEKAMHRGRIRPSVVYLSPTFNDDDRELTDAIAFHGNRPTLMVFSSEDLSAMRSIQTFRENKDVPGLQTRMYERAGRGLDTLRREPAALDYFQQWIRTATAP